jgi:tetratricopeptide (TPR) repeat protein
MQRYECVADILHDLESGANRPEADRPAGDPDPQDETWEQACGLVEHGRFDDALRLCRHILEQCPEHTDAKHMREAIEDRFHQADRLYRTIEDGMNECGLDELLEMLAEAARLYPEHASARPIQMRVTFKARQYRDAMQQGLKNAEDGNWEEALPCFEKAEQLCPGGTDVVSARRQAAEVVEFIRGERVRIDQAVAERNWDGALTLARRVDRRISQWTAALRVGSVRERS